MQPAVLSPTEIRDLAGLLYSALRPTAPRRPGGPPPERLRALLRRVREVQQSRLVHTGGLRRRAG